MFVTVKWLWRRPNAINSMRLRTDYWNTDDSDDFTSKCKEKKKTGLLRYMKWLNGVLAMLLVIEILLLWLHTLTCWWLYWNSWWCANDIPEIPGILNWYTYFLKLILTEEPNDYLIVETNTYENFPVSVLFVTLLVQGCQDIEWIF